MKYLVIGLGVFGRELAQSLIEKGAEVVAVDTRMEIVEEIQDQVTYAVKLNAVDERALSGIGVSEFDVGIVCIGENFEANLLAAVNLKKAGVKQVIARASNPTHQRILEAIGVDLVISPEVEAAERLSYRLMHKGLVDITFIGQGSVAAKIMTPRPFVGKSLAQLSLRRKYGINLIAIHSPQSSPDEQLQTMKINNSPEAETVLNEGDIMVFIGDNKALRKLTEL